MCTDRIGDPDQCPTLVTPAYSISLGCTCIHKVLVMLKNSLHLLWFTGFSLLLAAGCAETNNSGQSGGDNGPAGDTGAENQKTRRIVLLNNTDTPFWDAARAGIEKAVEDLGL